MANIKEIEDRQEGIFKYGDLGAQLSLLEELNKTGINSIRVEPLEDKNT